MDRQAVFRKLYQMTMVNLPSSWLSCAPPLRGLKCCHRIPEGLSSCGVDQLVSLAVGLTDRQATLIFLEAGTGLEKGRRGLCTHVWGSACILSLVHS